MQQSHHITQKEEEKITRVELPIERSTFLSAVDYVVAQLIHVDVCTERKDGHDVAANQQPNMNQHCHLVGFEVFVRYFGYFDVQLDDRNHEHYGVDKT